MFPLIMRCLVTSWLAFSAAIRFPQRQSQGQTNVPVQSPASAVRAAVSAVSGIECAGLALLYARIHACNGYHRNPTKRIVSTYPTNCHYRSKAVLQVLSKERPFDICRQPFDIS